MELKTASAPGRSVALSISSGASTSAGPFTGTMLRVQSTVAAFLTFGGTAVAASAASGSIAADTMFIASGSIEYFAMDPVKNYVAAIAQSTSGTVYITEMV